jgi:glycosyltransferase involved in cell wall biosynthesis
VIHAIDTLSTWFEKTAEHEWRPWKAMHLRFEARRARWSESHQYRNARVVTFVGPHDEETVRALLPRSVQTATIPIGIDTKEFYPADTPPTTTTLVFSGMMNYPPNVDAVVWFSREVWPAVRSRFPEARFRIVGKNPTSDVIALGRIPGIEVTGMVPSVSAELRAATLAVSPLRFGTGFKIKAIEALACGAPLIASPETIQGYDLNIGTDIVVADDAESWVVACTDLLRNQQRRAALRSHGLLAAQRYAWGTIAARYEALYDIACHG